MVPKLILFSQILIYNTNFNIRKVIISPTLDNENVKFTSDLALRLVRETLVVYST